MYLVNKMKKVLLIISLLLFVFSSCVHQEGNSNQSVLTNDVNSYENTDSKTDNTDEENLYSEHQFLNTKVLPVSDCSDEDILLEVLEESGICGLKIIDLSYGITSNMSDQSFPVCILGDYRYGSDSSVHDSYLAAATSDYVFLYDLSVDENEILYFFDDALVLGDINGDGVDEILIQQNTGGVGGAGSYISWILSIGKDGLIMLLRSGGEEPFDTGFRSNLMNGYRLQITNSFTGYDQVFDICDSHSFMFDEFGNPVSNEEITVDCFFRLDFTDADADGISEIMCEQYVSLHAHVNSVGIAKSILKFDTKKQTLIVVDAWICMDEQ